MATEKDTEKTADPKRDIDKTDTWINQTGTGKGFIIFVEDSFEKGDILLGSIKALEEFIAGKRKGINLGKMRPKED